MTDHKLSSRQREWLNNPTTTPEQRKTFLSRGPAHIITMMNINTDQRSYRPALRGVIVGESYPDAGAALAAAEAVRAEMAAVAVALDEHALGIDDTNLTITTLCKDANLRLERIVHVGAVAAQADAYDDDLLDDIAEALTDDAALCQQMGLKEALPDEDDLDHEERREELFQRIYDAGAFGILLQVATPHPTFSRDFSGYSFTWGHAALQWVYGNSMEEAVRRAAEWADSYREQQKSRQLPAAAAAPAE